MGASIMGRVHDEREQTVWTGKCVQTVGWPEESITILYMGDNIATYWVLGALATTPKYSMNSWVVSKKGSSYSPMFSPLYVMFIVVLGYIFIGDNVTVRRSTLLFLLYLILLHAMFSCFSNKKKIWCLSNNAIYWDLLSLKRIRSYCHNGKFLWHFVLIDCTMLLFLVNVHRHR